MTLLKEKITFGTIMGVVREYFVMTIGILLYTFAWIACILPAHGTGGGATGAALVLCGAIENLFNFQINIGTMAFIVNGILLLFAGFIIGWNFGIKTIFCIIVLPASLNFFQETLPGVQAWLAELGVIVLMFSAGLETDIQELKKAGLASFVIALLGVIVPLVGGFFLADFYNTEQDPEMAKLFWQNIFIGVVLTATSVSITVETLKELGALNSRAGNAILGAAVIDDILGIIALTVVISLGGKKSGDGEAEKTFGSLLAGDGVLAVVINILAFFIVAIGAAVLYHFFFKKWRESSNENLRRHNIVTFVFCLLLSFVAEICFGVADITGAFVAGLAVSGLKKNEYVVNRFNTLSYMLLSPIFFANIGLAMTLKGLTKKLVVFMLLLMLLAVVTKVIGCGLGAKIMRYTNKESLQIGIGMISRGEVALIVANKGASVGLMSEKFMTPLVIMVVFTTIVTPILLKLVFPKKKGGDKETVSDDLTALEKSGINTGLEES